MGENSIILIKLIESSKTTTVNNIGKRFFEKYYLIEKPRRKALEKYGVLDLYMKQRFNQYYVNWTLEHLSKVKSEDYKECALIAYDIFKVYEVL